MRISPLIQIQLIQRNITTFKLTALTDVFNGMKRDELLDDYRTQKSAYYTYKISTLAYRHVFAGLDRQESDE